MKIVRKPKQEETPKASMLDKIEKDLRKDGITLFEQDNVDEDYLTLPRDITAETSEELGKYLNAFTQQKMWTRTLIGRVAAMAMENAQKLDRERERIYSAQPPKTSVKEKELKVLTDAKCSKLVDDADYYKSKLAILDDYLENIVDAIFNISREISRRSSDHNNEGREHNVSNNKFGRRR
ncbi:hypothetical protein D1872_81340 [compost metagenome]